MTARTYQTRRGRTGVALDLEADLAYRLMVGEPAAVSALMDAIAEHCSEVLIAREALMRSGDSAVGVTDSPAGCSHDFGEVYGRCKGCGADALTIGAGR